VPQPPPADMQFRRPRPLQRGDLIAVPAPSSGVPAPLHPRLNLALNVLRSRGFRLQEGPLLRQEHQDASGSAIERAQELMQALLAPEVAAVMPPWGGERAIELLPLLNFQALAQAPAKWFCGFSDLSTLRLPLLLNAGWMSVHGPNLMELASTPLDDTTAGLWSLLHAPEGSRWRQTPSDFHLSTAADWVTAPQTPWHLGRPTRWLRRGCSADPLQVQGRLLGGCLDTISRLAGTPWGDLGRLGDQPLILFLDNAELRPCEFLRALFSLRLHGWLDRAVCLLIGRHAPPDANEADSLDFLGALDAAMNGLTLPVLHQLDIGHVPPQLSLLQGAWAELYADDEACQLTQTLSPDSPLSPRAVTP